MVSTKLRVKELLKERRWTTKVLAEKTGMSESYLTHIKNGTRRWNEDALKKLAIAFDLEATDIFDYSKNRTNKINTNLATPISAADIDLPVILAPVVGQIPSQPSAYNNQIVQQATGYKDRFIPILGEIEDDSLFALCLEDSSLAPKFSKGDFLVVSPGSWTNSGDIVAVEYDKGTTTRIIAQVNFMDDFVVLESINHKQAPIALVRGKDSFRIIGKVICRYQKL